MTNLQIEQAEWEGMTAGKISIPEKSSQIEPAIAVQIVDPYDRLLGEIASNDGMIERQNQV